MWEGLPHLVNEIRAWCQELGPAAPLGMIALLVLQQLFPLFPGGVLFALAGAMFGIPLGFAVVTLGGTAAAWTCHSLGRGPARILIHRWVGEVRMRAVEERLAHHGVPTVAAIRAFPFFPTYVVSYAAGIVGMPLRTYLLGSLIGTLPGNFLHVLLGDRLSDWRDPVLWVAMGGLVLLSGLAFLFERRMRARGKAPDSHGT